MEDLTTVLIGIGGLLVIINLLAGIIELATVGAIRPPEHRTFTYIRLAANQYQTIVVPALVALISGLLVSIAASFFYERMTEAESSWYLYAGLGAFLAAVFTLIVIFRFAIKGAGDPAELANDPFTIRAAAEEYSDDPRRGRLTPDFLSERLNKWESSLPRHSLNISKDIDASQVRKRLDKAADTKGKWRWIGASLAVYYSAVMNFPRRFGWPLLGPLALLTGTTWYGFAYSNIEVKHWWGPVNVIAIFFAIAVVPTLIYCVLRGNRARLWHRINLRAVEDARTALSYAQQSKASMKDEDDVLKRVRRIQAVSATSPVRWDSH